MAIHLKTDRILSLYDRLCRGQKISLKEEMNRTGASERSVKRDIAELRNYLESSWCQEGKEREIVYDRNENCYFLINNRKPNTGFKEAYAAAKILLGSKGLSKGEMRDILSFVLQSCGSDEERKEVRRLISNEFYYYQGPHHGRDILDMVWDIAEAVENKRKVRIQYERLEGKKTVERVIKPLGVLFSEYYFYMMAYIDGIEKERLKSPTIYRVDRIRDLEVLEEHFQIPYSEKFQEQEFRNAAPLMWGGELKRLKFWYSGPSLEAVLDRLPTAKVLAEKGGKYFLSAEVIGNGAEMWLKGQGERVVMLEYEEK